MPNALVIYMVAHQPRRIRLPAQLIPRGTPHKRSTEGSVTFTLISTTGTAPA